MTQATVPPTRRPRDRKAQIAGTAARLFAERGFHRVGMDELAAEVGITGGAIYRHFATKADLLARAVGDALAALEAAVEGDDQDTIVASLVDSSLRQPHVSVLLDRESRHLDEPELSSCLRRRAAAVARLRDAVRRTRPGLDETDATLLARSLLAAVASPSSHRSVLAPAAAEAVLTGIAGRVLATDAVPAGTGRPTEPRAGTARASRRESLLAAATSLFARHGYQGVKMEEIGAAAGIAGTSIYQHFPGKADLLAAAFNRGAEWLQLGVSEALSHGTDPADALRLVVSSYVDFVLSHAELIGLLLTESVHLPPAESQVLRRTQHDYVAEWVDVLVRVRPELAETEAAFRVHAALAVVNDVARPDRTAALPTAEALVALAREVLAA